MGNRKWIRLNSFQSIVLGFAGVILGGTGLLMLPFSTASGKSAPFLDALFTAATSVCVTGLVVQDTGTYWSVFGQVIILLLIQIGGLGVITVAALLAILSGRRIGLMQRSTIQEAVAAPKMGGIVRLTCFILKVTFLTELLGAAVMAPVFCRDFGPLRGLWMALFHSVSAFCNAGLDLMGIRGQYSSLTTYAADPIISITVMALIITGGIGFLTWDDVRTHGIHLKRYRMQSKVILLSSTLLILIPALWLYLEFEGMPAGQRVLSALFQAVTPRTAGFNTADLTALTQAAQFLIIILMLIGGSPGSTAGGMKTTTFAALLGCASAVFRRRDSVHFFGRRISQEAVSTATTLAVLYVGLSALGAMTISALENLPILTCLFETASAIATVGLTLGITPTLGTASRCILIALMYLGRVGGLTFIYAATSGRKVQMGRLPLDKFTVG